MDRGKEQTCDDKTNLEKNIHSCQKETADTGPFLHSSTRCILSLESSKVRTLNVLAIQQSSKKE